jgi:CheY-like chemotaxis protein
VEGAAALRLCSTKDYQGEKFSNMMPILEKNVENTRSKKVLVVDDVGAFRAVLGRMLQQMGLEVCLASSGEEALSICQKRWPDLILLDILMPGMGGFEVIRHLRAMPGGHGVPILLVSSHASEDVLAKGKLVGATDFVAKPLRPLVFKAKIEELLRAAEAVPSAPGDAPLEWVEEVVQGQLAHSPAASTARPALLTDAPELDLSPYRGERRLEALKATPHFLAVAEAFPHVGQRLLQTWGGADFVNYMDSLLHDKRFGRRGFPGGILWNLTELSELHSAVFPQLLPADDFWAHVEARRPGHEPSTVSPDPDGDLTGR